MRLLLRYTGEKEEISSSFLMPSLCPCPLKFFKCIMTYMTSMGIQRTLPWTGNPITHGIPFFFQPLQICSLIAGAIAVAPVRVNNTSNSRHKRELSLLKANSVIKTLLVQQGWTQKWIKTGGCYSRMLPKLSLCISASNATSTGLQKRRRAKKDLWLGEGSAVIPVRTTCY